MITEQQIQAIVDGECSHELRATLLRQMDSEPATWRTLALSLLEEQEWARQLSVQAKVDATSSRDSQASADPELMPHDLAANSKSVQRVVKLAGKTDGSGTLSSPPWLSVLAASLLLGLGFYGGSFLPHFGSLNSKATEGGTVAVSEKPSGIDPTDLIAKGDTDSKMRMLVSGPNSETAEIPIYDLNAMDHDVFLAKQAYEVARLNQQLRKEGFELDVRPEYYTGKLHDGRKLIVPVKHIGLKPYGL